MRLYRRGSQLATHPGRASIAGALSTNQCRVRQGSTQFNPFVIGVVLPVLATWVGLRGSNGTDIRRAEERTTLHRRGRARQRGRGSMPDRRYIGDRRSSPQTSRLARSPAGVHGCLYRRRHQAAKHLHRISHLGTLHRQLLRSEVSTTGTGAGRRSMDTFEQTKLSEIFE
jgi:hypothetical protein